MPFVPFVIGKWWGNSPVIKAQDDIDILALDKKSERAVFVSFFDEQGIDTSRITRCTGGCSATWTEIRCLQNGKNAEN